MPLAAGLQTSDKQKLIDQVYSQVSPQPNLSLADLSATALKKALGVQRYKRNRLKMAFPRAMAACCKTLGIPAGAGVMAARKPAATCMYRKPHPN